MIILPCTKRPDLDMLGGCFAYAEYLQRHEGKQAKIWLQGTPDGEAMFYVDKFQLTNFATNEEATSAQEFQLVDLSRETSLPDFIDRTLITKVIDHRFLGDVQKAFPKAIIELEPVGAAATQITEYFIRADLIPSEQSAAMLYGAIYSNTLCLKGNITTQRDIDAADWLKKSCPDCDADVQNQLNARKQDILNNLEQSVAAERVVFTLSSGTYGFTQFEMLGGEEFWIGNKERILDTLTTLPERSLFTIIDLTTNVTLVHVGDSELQQRITTEFKQEFSNDMIVLNPALMRKQIAKTLEDAKQ